MKIYVAGHRGMVGSAIVRALQACPTKPVIVTGVQYSVRQFIEWTATALGMQLRWEGTGVNKVGYAVVPGASREGPIVRIAPRYSRPPRSRNPAGRPFQSQTKTRLGACDHRARNVHRDGRQ